MNKVENLYFCVCEECGALERLISKAAIFGADNHHPSDDIYDTNAINIVGKFYEIESLIEMLQEKGVLPELRAEEINFIKNKKKERVNYYYNKYKERKNN